MPFLLLLGNLPWSEREALGQRVLEKAKMTTKRMKKYIHEGRYVAEVEVELIVDDTGWSPYLPLEEAYKLDNIREALRKGDLKTAARWSRVYELHPVAT